MKRIRQIIRKEFIQITRDRGLLRTVLLMPLIQLLIYGYVVATEIRALPIAVLDHSTSAEGRRLVDRFVSSGYFRLEEYLSSPKEIDRSEEHTSELQSPCNLVCRLLLEKKKKTNSTTNY